MSAVVVATLVLSLGAGAMAAQAADPPVVTSVSPNFGPLSGGNTVTVTGTGFTGATGVNFSATSAPSVTVLSDTQLTVVAPASSGSVHVRVTTPEGVSSNTSNESVYNYYATPAVTGISPSTGVETGGTTVTIAGSGFLNANAVTFGTTAGTSVSVINDNSITAVAPAGTGTVDVLVSSPGGISPVVAGDEFTYTAAPPAPPVVTGVSPNSGPEAGSTGVTITGTGFTGATGVSFGTTPVIYMVSNATTILALAPAGTGTVDVLVTTPHGDSPVSTADHYTYVAAPTVSGISPSAGPATGGTTVTLSGTNFTAGTSVTFGVTPATAVSYVSPTLVTATAPAGTGTVDLRVTTPGGTSATSSADLFTYIPAPTVSGISPASGAAVGGASVTITGTNFITGSTVSFGTTAASGVTVNTATSITATAPAGVGTVDVTVTNTGGTSATSGADQFTYLPAPTVTGINPSSGPTGGGTVVTITGTLLTGATSVKFGSIAATTFTVNSPTQITATAPASSAMTADVTVTTPNGTSATSAADRYTWVVGTLALSSNSVKPGDTITVTGSGFTPGATLTVELHSAPVTLATVTVGPSGTFSTAVTIPVAADAGAHSIVVADASVAITVTAIAAASTGLARTGADPSAPIGLAGALLAIGLLLLGIVGVRRVAR